MNIYEKISDIMSKVQKLQKDDKVSFGSTNYKALSEEKVTTIMREQLISHGLVVYPVHQTSSREGNITHVDVVYRMVNIENPEEYIEIASCGDGADTQDKGSGKAMTYAFKYMWLRTFALPTGEDPDKISSEELDAKEAKAKEKEETERMAKVAASTIDEIQVRSIMSAAERVGIPIEKILEKYEVAEISDMTQEQFLECNLLINKQEKALKKKS